MSIELSLVAHLKGYADLVALVGERIYPQQRTVGDKLPCLTYFLAASKPLRAMDATGGGLVKAEIEIRCWAPTHRYARQMAEAITGDPRAPQTKRLQDFNHAWLGTEQQRHWVQDCTIEEEEEGHEEPHHGKTQGPCHVTLKAGIWYDR
jgi:hypothetical protein